MINPICSNLGQSSQSYNLIKNISSYIYRISKKNDNQIKNIFIVYKKINRNIYRCIDKYSEKERFNPIFDNISMELFNELERLAMSNHILGKELIKANKSLIYLIKQTSNIKDLRKIRGLISEAILCASLNDCHRQTTSSLIWDVQFQHKGKIITYQYIMKNGKQDIISSTDVYLNNNDEIYLFESKTTPYKFIEKNEQLDFLNKIQIEYKRNTNKLININIFILEFKEHPQIDKLTEDKLFNYQIKIFSFEDLFNNKLFLR